MKNIFFILLFQFVLIPVLDSQEVNQLDSIINNSLYYVVSDTRDYYHRVYVDKKTIDNNFYILLDNTPYGYDISWELKKMGIRSSTISDILKQQNKNNFNGIRIGAITLNGEIIILKFYLISWKFNINNDLETIVEKIYQFTYKYSICSMKWEIFSTDPQDIKDRMK